MLTLTRMDGTELAGTMAENDPKTRSGGEAGRPRVSRDQRETVGRVTVDNPRMVCRGVNVYYGDKQAINNVSVDIGRNEVLAMIGPSGN